MSKTEPQLNLSLPDHEILEPTGRLEAPIQIVDLFAGPGGLGEGFSSSGEGKHFEIVVSAEKDPKAWQTLRLRAFYRLLQKEQDPALLREYYTYCNNPALETFSPSVATQALWDAAGKEAQCITLGSETGNQTLDEALDNRLDVQRPWVLIGGPPCQAYSIVGRARNQANANYRAEEDHRHFLYKEYLRIIRERQPTVFVMENVKGIISSKVNNERIFSNILKDLSDPQEALHEGGVGKQYRIYSLVTGDSFGPGDDVEKVDPRTFIIRAEKYGIPQARHRVILLGIATDSLPSSKNLVKLKPSETMVTVGQVLKNLPRLRSSLTKVPDSRDAWTDTVVQQATYLREQVRLSDIKMSISLGDVIARFDAPSSPGGKRVERAPGDGSTGDPDLDSWYLKNDLRFWLNHEVRGHMPTDLRRYLFAAVYAGIHGISPKGHKGFSLEGLAPDHKNWESGKFSDRFRVQSADKPATTITSHISKDGHYFIHYDPSQCRSLSVREAARIQTFPDDYFFQGNRTEQFHQVGNAVPPLLAAGIAKVVFRVLFDKVATYENSLKEASTPNLSAEESLNNCASSS
jgi:DNA (cytosine-5)-methyltransferase 1